MVLITGATGLVGSHAALFLLRKGVQVRAIYRDIERLKSTQSLFSLYGHGNLFDKIEWIEADINDVPALETAFSAVDEVWHCAALISFASNDEVAMRKVNIEGTANIVNLSIIHNVRKLCFVSSIAALGDLKEHETIVTEETEWNPEKHHSDYAISKYGAEMEILRGQQEGLQTIIINPGVILGPGFWDQGSGKIFSAVADDLPFYTKGSTGFVAVTDVVEIMYRLMLSDTTGERYCVVAENVVFRDLAFAIADAMKAKRPTIYAKPWMTEISWIMDFLLSKITGAKRKLFKETARSLHATDLYSSQKIRKELDFEFTNIREYVDEIVAVHKTDLANKTS
jgi:nucleoside-diphosphate-sugar epimerase